MIDLLDLHKRMLPNSISLSFKGTITVELIDSILTIISERLEKIEDNVGTRKKVYGVLLECLQNLCMHVDAKETVNEDENENNEDKSMFESIYDAKSALFMVDSNEEGYQIVTANFIPSEKVAPLKKWLEELNNFSKEELKELYNKVLRNRTFSEKGGAGLGFIDIARKVSHKMNYDFKSVDDVNSFFSLNIEVSKKV